MHLAGEGKQEPGTGPAEPGQRHHDGTEAPFTGHACTESGDILIIVGLRRSANWGIGATHLAACYLCLADDEFAAASGVSAA